MSPLKTLRSVRAAADAVTHHSAQLDNATTQLGDLSELRADAESTLYDVETAARTAAFAFGAVTIVALVALTIAVVALRRVP